MKLGLVWFLIFIPLSIQLIFSQDTIESEGQASQKVETVERVLIHLKNIPEGKKSLPGSMGLIRVENRRFDQQSQTLDGMAGFYNVPVHPSYTVTGYNKGGCKAFENAEELWGIWKDVTISEVSNEFTFERNMPYILDVSASFERDNISNPSLQQGDELSFNVVYNNLTNENYRTQVVLLLRNASTGAITRLQKEENLEVGQATVSFSYTALTAGEYYFAAGLFVRQRIKAWTDCWDWSADPLYVVSKEHRTLSFAGYSWDVKAGMGNPGNNLWSNDSSDIWVDERGRLNLTLAPKENGKWYSTEVISHKTFGYGTYTFYLDAEPQLYDPHVVAAIFLYKDEQNEIDIEFSRWGDKENYQLGNYAIQPASEPGNHFQFPILTSGTYTTHQIVWKPGEILFASWHGHYQEPPVGKYMARWQYSGAHIPKDDNLKLFFNIWLFRGITPKSEKKETFTIAEFTYLPLAD